MLVQHLMNYINSYPITPKVYITSLNSHFTPKNLAQNVGHTLQEVGDEFGVTRERIRQIQAKALTKLRHSSRSKRLAFMEE